MRPSRIQAVDHVHRQAPVGLDELLRWFYVRIGCLEEAARTGDARMVFRSVQLELRIDLTQEPRIESTGFPVVLAVPSLERAGADLRKSSWPFARLTGTTWADRCLAALDPAGNRVEFRQEWPFGLL